MLEIVPLEFKKAENPLLSSQNQTLTPFVLNPLLETLSILFSQSPEQSGPQIPYV